MVAVVIPTETYVSADADAFKRDFSRRAEDAPCRPREMAIASPCYEKPIIQRGHFTHVGFGRCQQFVRRRILLICSALSEGWHHVRLDRAPLGRCEQACRRRRGVGSRERRASREQPPRHVADE